MLCTPLRLAQGSKRSAFLRFTSSVALSNCSLSCVTAYGHDHLWPLVSPYKRTYVIIIWPHRGGTIPWGGACESGDWAHILIYIYIYVCLFVPVFAAPVPVMSTLVHPILRRVRPSSGNCVRRWEGQFRLCWYPLFQWSVKDCSHRRLEAWSSWMKSVCWMFSWMCGILSSKLLKHKRRGVREYDTRTDTVQQVASV